MMFSKSLIASSLALLSLSGAAIANPVEEVSNLEARQNQADPDLLFRVSKFRQECHQGRCSYQMQIDADGTEDIPYGFTVSCNGRDTPRGDTTLRNCSINRGDKIQSAKAFIEQRPLRPNRQTKLVIEIGVNNGGGRVTYWRAERMGTWYDWQALSVAQEFEIYAHQFAAVA